MPKSRLATSDRKVDTSAPPSQERLMEKGNVWLNLDSQGGCDKANKTAAAEEYGTDLSRTGQSPGYPLKVEEGLAATRRGEVMSQQEFEGLSTAHIGGISRRRTIREQRSFSEQDISRLGSRKGDYWQQTAEGDNIRKLLLDLTKEKIAALRKG